MTCRIKWKVFKLKNCQKNGAGKTRRNQILFNEDRISGAVKIGSFWAIPYNAKNKVISE